MVSQTVEKPLYLQLVDELEVAIRERMAPNDKLFSERELTQVYGVSRITVRLALQELEKRGLVYKKHGREPMYLRFQILQWICLRPIVLLSK